MAGDSTVRTPQLLYAIPWELAKHTKPGTSDRPQLLCKPISFSMHQTRGWAGGTGTTPKLHVSSQCNAYTYALWETLKALIWKVFRSLMKCGLRNQERHSWPISLAAKGELTDPVLFWTLSVSPYGHCLSTGRLLTNSWTGVSEKGFRWLLWIAQSVMWLTVIYANANM